MGVDWMGSSRHCPHLGQGFGGSKREVVGKEQLGAVDRMGITYIYICYMSVELQVPSFRRCLGWVWRVQVSSEEVLDYGFLPEGLFKKIKNP